MKIMIYCYREFDEKEYLDELCAREGFEYVTCEDYPTLETAHLAKGCDAISTIVTDVNEALLTALAEQDRVMFGRGVRDYWASVEEELTTVTFPAVLAETAALYANDPAAAAAYITEWTIDNQEQYLAEADLIYDELTWYMIKNNVQQKYGYDSAKLAMNDTYTQAPFVPSLAIAE